MWLALIALVAAATPAKNDAEGAFRRGRDLMAEGRVEEACAAFAESQRIDPALGTLLNLAECEARLGHHAKAWGLFTEVLAWSRRKENHEREKVALERLATLRPQLAVVVIEAPPGTRLSVDGAEVVAGAPFALEPGPHVVERTREGAEPQLTPLKVEAGQTLVLPAQPPVVETAPPRLEPERPAESTVVTPPAMKVEAAPEPLHSSRATAGKFTLAAGAVLAIAGGVGIGICASVWNQGERQKLGGPDAKAPSLSLADYQAAGRWYPVSWVVAAVGVAAVVVGAGLWWFAAPSPGGAQVAVGARF